MADWSKLATLQASTTQNRHLRLAKRCQCPVERSDGGSRGGLVEMNRHFWCERSLMGPSGQSRPPTNSLAGGVLTALDVDGAGGVLPPQRVLRHTRVIPRILQPGAVDLDSGVFAAGEKHSAGESRERVQGPGIMETTGGWRRSLVSISQ